MNWMQNLVICWSDEQESGSSHRVRGFVDASGGGVMKIAWTKAGAMNDAIAFKDKKLLLPKMFVRWQARARRHPH